MPELKNARDERFAQAYALSNNASDAYRKSGGKAKNADVQGAKWVVKGGILERVAEIRGENAKRSRLTKDKLLEWLERVILAKPSEADQDSDICETIMTKAGPFTRVCDKHAAITSLARMCGWNEAEKHQHDIGDKLASWLAGIRKRK